MVAADVRTALREKKQVELAVAALTDGRERIAGGATLDELAAELGVGVEESEEFARGDSIGSLGPNLPLARTALALDEGAIGGPVSDLEGAVLFEVTERKRFDPATFEQEKDSTRSGLVTQRANEMLGGLIASRRDEMGVVYDPSFFENFQSSES